MSANEADGNGGGCDVDYNGKAGFLGGMVSGNHGGTGGGVYVAIGGRLTMDKVPVIGNRADGAGGGVFLDYSAPLTLHCCVLNNNIAGGNGGGVNCVMAVSYTHLTLPTIYSV